MADLDQVLAEAGKHRIRHHKISEQSHIQNFINDNEIKEGTSTVPVKYVYALYCDQLRPPIARRRFTMYFKTFFKRHNTASKHFYRLDPSPFNMPENYSIWKEQWQRKFIYKKTKYNNIKSTPEGWMIYLNVLTGRKIFKFESDEIRAARTADLVAWFYFGPDYKKFNFPTKAKLIKEDDELLALLRLKKDMDDKQQKETL